MATTNLVNLRGDGLVTHRRLLLGALAKLAAAAAELRAGLMMVTATAVQLLGLCPRGCGLLLLLLLGLLCSPNAEDPILGGCAEGLV